MSIRALPWLFAALDRIVRAERPDLVCLSIPPNYSAILGPLVRLRHGIPYVVDYQDPWNHPWPGCQVRFSKAWWAYQIGRGLERPVLRYASLLTGAGAGYYAHALERAPWLDARRCVAAPIGAEASDFQFLDDHPRPPTLFDHADGARHVVYAGALLPRAFSTLEALFAALRLNQDQPRLRMHFIGTGGAVRRYADRCGMRDRVFEHPARIPYLDVLNHLKHAHAVLVMGSDEPHYTPSKVFQAVLARRPVVGLLHGESSGATILRQANAGPLVTFNAQRPASTRVADIAEALSCATQGATYSPEQVNWGAFAGYSAEVMTRQLASGFDAALEARC